MDSGNRGCKHCISYIVLNRRKPLLLWQNFRFLSLRVQELWPVELVFLLCTEGTGVQKLNFTFFTRQWKTFTTLQNSRFLSLRIQELWPVKFVFLNEKHPFDRSRSSSRSVLISATGRRQALPQILVQQVSAAQLVAEI